MKVMLEFWGEHRNFALSEIHGILLGEGHTYSIVDEDFPVSVLDMNDWTLLRRAGFLRYISAHIASGDDLPTITANMDDYAVRARVYHGLKDVSPSEIERKVGNMIKGKVNLNSPKFTIRVGIANKYHIGVLMHDFSAEDFEARKPSNFPISYPITMHPRYTRALINISRIKTGSHIIDPFCGTGSIALEASLMGMKVTCSDIDPKMIHAAEINLQKFGAYARFMVKDVGDVSGNYEAVVTDPPYGRSSSSMGENVHKLYERAFKRFSEITNKVSIVLPDREAVKIGKEYFSLQEIHPVRVHKSLTRYYCLFAST